MTDPDTLAVDATGADQRIVNLAGLGLNAVPPELLVPSTDVTDLTLANNALRAVPDVVYLLPKLRSLNLSGNRLTAIPAGLGRLRHLTDLVLDENELAELPADLADLIRLRRLSVRGNQLRHLPPAVADLLRLRQLRLDGNALSELPDEIGYLDELAVLTVSHNRLRSLPSSLEGLRQLYELDVSHNLISELPAQLGALTHLQALWVGGNRLRDIPGQLAASGLRRLGLTDNGLDTLPATITEMTGLEELNLDRNGLTELPGEIGRLGALQLLDLSGNQLRRLPSELALLDQAITLRLDGNPLQEPLPSLLNAPTLGPLFTYLRSIEGAEPQYEAKLLLVGEGAVGKSSLLAALRGENFIEDRDTTHGIERRTITMRHPELDADLTLNAWDFGGQEVYRITHQFFFSERALYLLVWAPRQGQEQNEVEGWLRRIQLRVTDAKVIIVATHSDAGRNPDLDYPGLRSRFGHMLVGHVAVDNRSGNGIAELRRLIGTAAAALPQMGAPWSVRWAAVSRDLELLQRPQIPLAEFVDLCHQRKLDDEETATLAKLLHELGHIIHYATDEGLRDVVVLQPEWLTKAISYVLEDRATRDSGGVLQHDRLRGIWHRRDVAYPVALHPYFLRLMEKFDVCYRIADHRASLVAQLVPYERPLLAWEPPDPPAAGQRQLALFCTMSDEAPGLIAWLMVRNHRFTTGTYWRHGMLLGYPQYESQALIVLDSPRRLRLTVRGPSPDHFFGVLRDSVEYLIVQRWPGLRYEFYVPCPGAADDGGPCPGRFRLPALLRGRERGVATITCQECLQDRDIAELLTGFPSASGSSEQQLDQMQVRLNEIATRASGLTDLVQEVQAGVHRVEAHTAETADAVRKVLKIIQIEVTDCPRMFTVRPVRRAGLGHLRRWQRSVRLTLWCEQSGAMHSCADAGYEITSPAEWLTRVAPYAVLVVKSLRLVLPIAGIAGQALLDESEGKALASTLDAMTRLVDIAAASTNLVTASADTGRQSPHGDSLTTAQGDGLRALRSLLFTIDPTRSFGGIRRVIDQTGDIVWVCPTHYKIYDPGLPQLP